MAKVTKTKLSISFSPFILAQIDEMIPVYGQHRAEVIRFILQNWLTEHCEDRKNYIASFNKLKQVFNEKS